MTRILNPNVHYIIGNVTDKKNFDRKFDIVTVIEVLEHIAPEKLPKFLEELHYFLNEKGLLIITVPSKNIRVRSKHYQHFDVKTLEEFLSPHFIISEKYFLNKIGLKTKIIKKLLSNSLFILNSKYLLNIIYNYNIKKLLITDEKTARRICLFCKKKI